MPPAGFEPARLSALVPKTRMSTSSITKANNIYNNIKKIICLSTLILQSSLASGETIQKALYNVITLSLSTLLEGTSKWSGG